MCEDEVVGDWYRLCSHFIMSYETGERFDCEQESCALSKVHVHKALNCRCTKEPEERRRIQNTFYRLCDPCTNAEFARLVDQRSA